MAAIGLWYDDYTAGDPNPVTQDLLNVLSYSTGVDSNDVAFRTDFPYMGYAHRGTGACGGLAVEYTQPDILDPSDGTVGISEIMHGAGSGITAFPNPITDRTTLRLNMAKAGHLRIEIHAIDGKVIAVPFDGTRAAGNQEFTWNAGELSKGIYLVKAVGDDGKIIGAMKLEKN